VSDGIVGCDGNQQVRMLGRLVGNPRSHVSGGPSIPMPCDQRVRRSKSRRRWESNPEPRPSYPSVNGRSGPTGSSSLSSPPRAAGGIEPRYRVGQISRKRWLWPKTARRPGGSTRVSDVTFSDSQMLMPNATRFGSCPTRGRRLQSLDNPRFFAELSTFWMQAVILSSVSIFRWPGSMEGQRCPI
jgi:hypothetical protein